MRSRSLLLAALASSSMLAVFACSDGPSSSYPQPLGTPSSTQPGPREVARTVYLRVTVRDVTGAASTLRESVERHRGYVATATQAGSRSHASFVVRVPVDRLDAHRAEVRALGALVEEREASEDVTDARADVGARLRNARREEERLLTLLSERTATLEDVLVIEARLATVRERVEQLDAGERGLADRVSLAEVRVELAPEAAPFWREPGATLSGAAAFGLEAVAAIVVGGGAIIVGIGPTVALAVLVLLVLVFGVRGVLGARRALGARRRAAA